MFTKKFSTVSVIVIYGNEVRHILRYATFVGVCYLNLHFEGKENHNNVSFSLEIGCKEGESENSWICLPKQMNNF